MGILVERVYKDFRQFETADDLMEHLLAEWEKLKKEDWIPLILSMQVRCMDVIADRGGNNKYWFISRSKLIELFVHFYVSSHEK